MPDTESPQDFGPSTQQFDAAVVRDALPAGTRLGGYQIIEVLGRGSFGIVYLALDASLQRQVAIKEYLPTNLAMRCEDQQVWVQPGVDVNAYAEGKAAFLNEAKLLARFDHPSLARVHSYWEENRTAYMVMSYYHGDTLAATLAAMPQPPDEAWLRKLLTPLLGALSMLHAAECLHLDISPDNILVGGDGRPVLLDLGVAHHTPTDKTLRLSTLLNPAYAPIEQYSESASLPQGPWTDLYSLAAVLHFAITGQPPARATVRAVEDPQRPLAEAVLALKQRFPGIDYSASFLNGIDRALSVKPRDRPRDVGDFQQALDHASPRQAPTASRVTRTEPAFEATRSPDTVFSSSTAPGELHETERSNLSLWLAGLFVIALAALGVWLWTQWQPQAPLVTTAQLPPAVAMAPAPSASMAIEAAASAAAPPLAALEPAASAVVNTIGSPAASPATSPIASAVVEAAVAPTLPASTVAVEPPASAAVEAAAPRKPTRALAEAAAAETPRGNCGSRSNFSLVYCMQTQCKRPKFAQHPQCSDMRQRGEIN
jgi:serine/threonine protein kinase